MITQHFFINKMVDLQVPRAAKESYQQLNVHSGLPEMKFACHVSKTWTKHFDVNL